MTKLEDDIAQILFDAVAASTGNSTAYALPVGAQQVTWQTSFGSAPASITLQLQTSNDNSIWSTVDSSTSTGGESKTLFTSALFVRARINAVSSGSGVTVVLVTKRLFSGSSASGGGALLTKSFELSSANILSLSSTAGITAIPAPGTNKVIQMLGASVLTAPGTIAYANGSKMAFGVGPTVSVAEIFGDIDTSIFTSATSKYATSTLTNVGPSGSNALNQPLLIFLEGASYTAGNGTVKVVINYSVNDFN